MRRFQSSPSRRTAVLAQIVVLTFAAGALLSGCSGKPASQPKSASEAAASPEPSLEDSAIEERAYSSQRTQSAPAAEAPIPPSAPTVGLEGGRAEKSSKDVLKEPSSAAPLSEWQSFFESQLSSLSASKGLECISACDALGGLERARDKICEIVGETDEEGRCERAKQRADSARNRVNAQCRCTKP